MKTEQSISKGVRAIGILGIALTAIIVWNHFRIGERSAESPQPETVLQAEAGIETQTFAVVETGSLPPLIPIAPKPDLSQSNQISVQVVNSDSQPISQAKLRILFVQGTGADQHRVNKSENTDAAGNAFVTYPAQQLNRLEITASDEEHSSRKMVWDLGSGDTIPASYTLRLASAISINGIVVDVAENPISDAKISLHRFWSGGEDLNKKGDQSDFPSQTVATDAQGKWSAKGLPPALLDHINLDVSHPDFIGTNYNVAANENRLRSGTFKAILRRGTDAHGIVTDENDNPISGATVWAGRRFFRDRQQTKTDAQGKFIFHSITGGEVLFSASATGRAPENKTFNVKSDMPEIVFKLNPGHVIRATVQDESGSPIPDVRVTLEGFPGEPSYDAYEFSANTDSNGNFQWDAAPADPMPFYFGKQGYEQKRRVLLKPDQDNTITLRSPRKLQGIVLDANTGQPIPKFSVRVGQKSGGDNYRIQGAIRSREFSAADGRFTMDLDEENCNAVQVSSDDYATETELLPEAQNGIVQLTVSLARSAALEGVVISPDGVTLPGVTVTISTGVIGAGPYFQNGRFRQMDPQLPVATTDADGKFSLATRQESGTVLAAGSSGFGSAPVSQVRAGGVLVLQAYGRIEGTLKIAGVPTAGQDLLFTMTDRGVSSDFNKFKVTTDEQGQFSIEDVPPGEGSIVRLVKTSESSWVHSHSTPVTVDPGKTTQVTLGDSGALIKGTARFQTPPADGETLIVSGQLNSKMPALPPLLKQRQFFSAVVGADGSFQFDSVPPGDYTLTIEARKRGERMFMGMPVAQGSTTVTVPESANQLSPIPVGEIVLLSRPNN